MGVERRGSGQWHYAADTTGENDEANIRAAATKAMASQGGGFFHCETVADSLANGLLRADKHPATAGIALRHPRPCGSCSVSSLAGRRALTMQQISCMQLGTDSWNRS